MKAGTRDPVAVVATRIDSMLLGAVRPFGPKGVPSGIDKQPVGAAVRVTAPGLAGHGQEDHRHHGGPEKAIHHYAFDPYPAWRQELSALSAQAAEVLVRPARLARTWQLGAPAAGTARGGGEAEDMERRPAGG